MAKRFNPTFFDVFGGETMSAADVAKYTVRHIMRELNPFGRGRKDIAKDREHRRERQKASAAWYLRTGEQDGETPPYGTEWDREYNPMPYPEAKPDLEMYAGSAIGQMYGLLLFTDDGEPYLPVEEELQVVGKKVVVAIEGWAIVGKGAEVRARRKW